MLQHQNILKLSACWLIGPILPSSSPTPYPTAVVPCCITSGTNWILCRAFSILAKVNSSVLERLSTGSDCIRLEVQEQVEA